MPHISPQFDFASPHLEQKLYEGGELVAIALHVQCPEKHFTRRNCTFVG